MKFCKELVNYCDKIVKNMVNRRKYFGIDDIFVVIVVLIEEFVINGVIEKKEEEIVFVKEVFLEFYKGKRSMWVRYLVFVVLVEEEEEEEEKEKLKYRCLNWMNMMVMEEIGYLYSFELLLVRLRKLIKKKEVVVVVVVVVEVVVELVVNVMRGKKGGR